MSVLGRVSAANVLTVAQTDTDGRARRSAGSRSRDWRPSGPTRTAAAGSGTSA